VPCANVFYSNLISGFINVAPFVLLQSSSKVKNVYCLVWQRNYIFDSDIEDKNSWKKSSLLPVDLQQPII